MSVQQKLFSKKELQLLADNTKILITGGAGYIGSRLVESLIKLGKYDIRVIDNLLYEQTSLFGMSQYGHIDFHYQDVTDYEAMVPHYRWADIIIPLAAVVGMPACNSNKKYSNLVNYKSIERLVKCWSNKRIIYPTTNSGYGTGLHKDGEAILCTEETPLAPISEYGIQKSKAERELIKRCPRATCLRLATVFGTSQRMRLDLLVNDFVYRAVKDRSIVLFEPHFKRNYVHVMDVVAAIIFCMYKEDDTKGEIFNIGLSKANLSKLELCELIQKYVDFDILVSEKGKDPDKRNYIVSNKKIEKIGFESIISLDTGIMELVELYKQVIPLDTFSKNH